jgi:hypothetical protein
MFCSIEDAWGEKNFSDKPIFKQSDKPEHFKTDGSELNYNSNKQEHLTFDGSNLNYNSKQQLYNKYVELKEMFDTNDNNIHEHFNNSNKYHNDISPVCNALDAHIIKCEYCRNKYYQKQQCNNFDFGDIITNIKTNKDIVTIFLLGLLVILLVQLFTTK